jgi:hypothetical protein
MCKAMQQPRMILLAGGFLALLLIGLSGPSVYARETFKDDAGRVTFIIDDDGTVSMFETDALDNTTFVAQGSRESMKPFITEVFPTAVEAGKMSVVIFKGSNLVGAKFRTRTPGVRFAGSAPRAVSAGVFLMVEPTVQPGPLTVELETPIGSTSATITVTERRAGAADLAAKEAVQPKVSAAGKPESCPAGMVAVANAGGGFCIDIGRTPAGDWFHVEKACSYEHKRLCWAEEWELACKENQKSGLGLQNLLGEWEWTRNSEYAATGVPRGEGLAPSNEDWRAVVRGLRDCESVDRKDPWTGGMRAGRCCK